ncbi:hypothetical protein UlMin_033345 [Ulmus minor]
MAEAFLSVLLENLNSLIQKRVGLLWGVNREMEKLSSMLSTIVAVLEDAEERQFTDRAIKNWLQKLTDVSYELDDILDEFEIEAFRMEYDRWTKKVCSSLSCFRPRNTLFRFKIANKMKDVGDRLDQIANERMGFHLRESVGVRPLVARGGRQTGSIISQPHVYGREEDKERIINFLVNDAKDISIYPIIGLGGMGKTTLAQLVFNDDKICGEFELKMWVCVSEDFDVKSLVKAIIESAIGRACDALDMDPLQKRLLDLLRGRKFLLVLDDVWNEDQEQWDKLKSVLACGSSGSSVLVTTRMQTVASIMGTIPAHHLSGLSEDDCWLLFKQRAFDNESKERPNLLEIGKEIVKKCGGVPLAAKALGGLLRFKFEENEWLSVLRSELWNLPQDGSSILPALRLSYLHLPIEQRRCFAYCAIFPKDHVIERERIIRLWMANGFLSSRGEMEVEEIGNEIFKELYWRSFFQDIENDRYGNTRAFKIHDLMHDLAQSVMADECRIVELHEDHKNNIILSTRVRHLTCTASNWQQGIDLDITSAQSLRTLLLLRNSSLDNFSYHLNFRSLRAFDASLFRMEPISPLISKLKHLRYLCLSDNKIRSLPESIVFQQHLQTLDLSHCWNLRKLPKHFSRLKSLRHLDIRGCRNLCGMPPNISRLTSLRTLSNFIVGRRRGCHLEELRDLNLGGHLEISSLENVGSPIDSKNAKYLLGKRNLKGLHLSWGGHENETGENAEQVIEALEPSPNLEVLQVDNYKRISFPRWWSYEVLKNVVSVTLSNCENCSELPPLGKLISLRHLRISGMRSVRYLDNEPYDGGSTGRFMGVEELDLSNLPNLERLSREEGGEMFLSMSRFLIDSCPKLVLPFRVSVKHLIVYNCSGVLLKSISNSSGVSDLRISGTDNKTTSFPKGMIRNLTGLCSLTIDRFANLQELPRDMFNGINTLEALAIEFCPELKCLPEGIFQNCCHLKRITIRGCKKLNSLSQSFQDLISLQSLVLQDFPELNAFPNGLDHLSSLTNLSMSGLSLSVSGKDGYSWTRVASHKLGALPEALQHLPSLKSLTIEYFLELSSLPGWVGNLASLQELHLKGCPDLLSIPTSIQQLCNLEKLTIEDCPQLEKQYEKEVGADWHNIAHIANVYVGPYR